MKGLKILINNIIIDIIKPSGDDKLKRLFTVLIMLLFVVSLTGCGDSNSSNNGSNSKDDNINIKEEQSQQVKQLICSQEKPLQVDGYIFNAYFTIIFDYIGLNPPHAMYVNLEVTIPMDYYNMQSNKDEYMNQVLGVFADYFENELDGGFASDTKIDTEIRDNKLYVSTIIHNLDPKDIGDDNVNTLAAHYEKDGLSCKIVVPNY